MTSASGTQQAVVLSSGGADGAYAVGAMKALVAGQSAATGHQPLDPQIVKGSSIGAFNAAYLVSYLEKMDAVAAVANLEHCWLEDLAEHPDRRGNGAYRFRGDLMQVLDAHNLATDPVHTLGHMAEDSLFLARDWFERILYFAASDEPLAKQSLKLLDLSSFISSEPLLRLIERVIDFDRIRQSSRKLKIAVTNWDTGEMEIFSNRDMTDEHGPSIVLASQSLPGFFAPVEINGNLYVDAAVLGYARLDAAIDAGAGIIHVIYVDPDIENIPGKALHSTLETLYRVFVLTWAERLNRSIKFVNKINKQIKVLDEIAREAKLSQAQIDRTLQALVPPTRRGRSVSRLAIHRYHPRDDLYGPLGILNLDRDRIGALIKRGYKDTVQHDCADSECALLD